MKLCILAGTFNPIHNAHLAMGNFVLEHFDFDKILYIPAFQPPHKKYDDKLCEHRFNMVKLAAKNNPHFEVSDIEFCRNEKSYTYKTICELYEKYSVDGKINLIIGTDAFEKIESWYETDKLKDIVDFIVFIRENEKVDFTNLKNKGYNFVYANMEFIDISSTDIRNNIKNSLPINRFVPKEVEEYIIKNGLYKD